MAIKTRLLERSALVAELHPDALRTIELDLEEQAKRTVSASAHAGRGAT